MTLLLSDQEVAAVIAEEQIDLIAVLEDALRGEAAGQAEVPSRLNLGWKGGFLRIGPARLSRSGVVGFKAFNGRPGASVSYMICLYEQGEGELLAIMDARYLTAARTGAATALATKHLARESAQSVGLIGSGLEARTNLEAVAGVMRLERGEVYSPNPDRRKRFAQEMSARVGIEIIPRDKPEEVVASADVVVVATNSGRAADPITFHGSWMQLGQHVNTVGSTSLALREVDTETFRRADVVVVDSKAHVDEESGDVVAARVDGAYPVEVLGLKDLVTGSRVGRSDLKGVTLYKSVGTGLEDIAVGAVVYKAACQKSLGRELGRVLVAKEGSGAR